MNSNPALLTDPSKDNVKKVLKQIDLALAKKGIIGHQERLLRIYKTVMAVEKHSNCFVSRFQGENGNENENQDNYFRTFDEVNKPSLNLHTDRESKKVEFEFEDVDPNKKSLKIGMDELLLYVENELGVKDNLISDSSDDCGKETDSSLDKDGKKQRNKELDKKFFNIELKLRTFIKENESYDIFSKSSFKSFVEDQRLKTPCSMKGSKGKDIFSPLPLSYNFFKEKEVIEVCQKRFSLNQNLLRNRLDKFSQGFTQDVNKESNTPKFGTNVDFKAPTYSAIKKEEGEKGKISKFCVDDDIVNEDIKGEDLVTPKLPLKHSFSIEKRGSIFSDEKAFSKDNIRFNLQAPYVEDDDDQSDISSPIKSFRNNHFSPEKTILKKEGEISPKKLDKQPNEIKEEAHDETGKFDILNENDDDEDEAEVKDS